MIYLGRLWTLFWAAAGIGAVALGGGYIMTALARTSFVDKRKWISESELMDYFAMAQTLPGIIALNFMAFLGYKRAGWFGTLVAVLGVVFVPIIFVSLLATFVQQADQYPMISHFMSGAQIAACVLIALAVIDFYKKFVRGSTPSWGLFAGAVVCYLIFNFSPILLIVGAVLFGAVWYYKTRRVFRA